MKIKPLPLKFFYLLLLFGMGSCATVIDATDLNTSGVVSKVKPLPGRAEGDMMYLLRINPEQRIYVKLVTFGRFNIGDTVFFSTQIYGMPR